MDFHGAIIYFFAILYFVFRIIVCLNRNVFAKLLQTAMTKSMCVARLNNYMSFFANAVKINRSAIFPTCLFFFFVNRGSICADRQACVVYFGGTLCCLLCSYLVFSHILFPSKHLLEDVTSSPLQNMVHLNFLNFSISLI